MEADPNLTADAIAAVAELIRSGMPVPMGIVPRPHGVEIQPLVEDLPRWIALLDLPAPDWVSLPLPHGWGNTGDYLHAEWPDGTFADKPVSLVACRRVGAPALTVVGS